MMSRVPLNTLHFIPIPWEICVMRICVSGRLDDSVRAFSVLVLLVKKVLVDLGVGVVGPYGRCCAS
jgi:hypothetical protein